MTEHYEPLDESVAPFDVEDLKPLCGGGVSSARGFKACGIAAGFRKNEDPDRLDLALVAADQPCAAAATFTQNVFCAAPVLVSRAHLAKTSQKLAALNAYTHGSPTPKTDEPPMRIHDAANTSQDDNTSYKKGNLETKDVLKMKSNSSASYGRAQAVIVNSGSANAATGEEGLKNAQEVAKMTADALGCCSSEVLVASTGVIGTQLPLDPFRANLTRAVRSLSFEGGTDAACAIMTTDTKPKEAAFTFQGDAIGYPGCTFTVGGMAKGSGMIMPHMATMIAILTTDAPLLPDVLHEALVRAVNVSFNKVTVDSDTSTNDTCVLLASGSAVRSNGAAQSDGTAQPNETARPGGASQSDGIHPVSHQVSPVLQSKDACGEESTALFSTEPFAPGSAALDLFEKALQAVCITLARSMAEDGEGATKLVTVTVLGARNASDADVAARAVANSPLVKTAIFGHDANWGRIAAALGKSGACFDQSQVSIDIMGLPVCRKGLALVFDEEEALRRFKRPEIDITVDLGAGQAKTTLWTCDFSHDYITINGDYRT